MKRLKHYIFAPPPPPPEPPPAPPPPPLPPDDQLQNLFISRSHLERISRLHSQALPIGDGTILCRVLGRYLCYVSARDESVTPHLAMTGCWETWTTLALQRLIQPGWHCVDGGANVGYFSLLMADRVGAEGRVAVCEPQPALAELLRKTCAVNGFTERVQLEPHAIGAVEGQPLSLGVPGADLASARLFDSVPENHASIPVKTRTIDAITGHWPRVDLIKLDVEGFEYQAWQGMQKTIARHRDLVLVLEFNPQWMPNGAAFLAELQAAGFGLHYIDYDGHVVGVKAEEVLARTRGGWMLCLQRPPVAQPVPQAIPSVQ